jgi:hypothetical protein
VSIARYPFTRYEQITPPALREQFGLSPLPRCGINACGAPAVGFVTVPGRVVEKAGRFRDDLETVDLPVCDGHRVVRWRGPD